MKTLYNIQKLLSIIDQEVDGLEFSLNNRNMVSGALFDIVLEHAKAIVFLLENQFHASAYALARPLFEGFVRATWIQNCAVDDEVEYFVINDKFKLNFGEMLELVEAQKEWPNTLTQIKKNAWNIMNSYTHGGLQQISRRLKAETIQSNIDDQEIEELIKLVTYLSFLSLTEIVGICKTPEKDKVLNDIYEWMSGWCLTDKSDRGLIYKEEISQLLEKEAPLHSASAAESVVPHSPGFYSIFIDDPANLPCPYCTILQGRPTNLIYIGIATKSLQKRLVEQDLRHKSPSTFFRGIGPILGFRPPRGSLIGKKNQNNYKFSQEDTHLIITWINEHLSIRLVTTETSEHPNTEEFAIKRNRPILNTKHNPDKLTALAELRATCRRIALAQ